MLVNYKNYMNIFIGDLDGSIPNKVLCTCFFFHICCITFDINI